MGVRLAGHAATEGRRFLAELTRGKTALRGLVFEAESVNLDVFRQVTEEACLRLEPPERLPEMGDPLRVAKQKQLIDRLNARQGASNSVLETTMLAMTEDSHADFREVLVEQMRRFRRFALYAQGAASTSGLIGQYGFLARGFIDKNLSSDKDHQMAVYWQPPIVANADDPDLPVRDDDKCAFSLFILMAEKAEITAQEIVDWEYDVFLGEQLCSDVCYSGLTGWTDFMVGFKERHRSNFIESAKLADVQMGRSYSLAQSIITAHKNWIAKKWPGWEIIRQRIPLKL